jgi:hypothetical protein
MNTYVYDADTDDLLATAGDFTIAIGEELTLFRTDKNVRCVVTKICRSLKQADDTGRFTGNNTAVFVRAVVGKGHAVDEKPVPSVTELWAAVRYRLKKGQTGTAAFLKFIPPVGYPGAAAIGALFTTNVREAQLFPGVLGWTAATQAADAHPTYGDTHEPAEVVSVRMTTKSVSLIEVIEPVKPKVDPGVRYVLRYPNKPQYEGTDTFVSHLVGTTGLFTSLFANAFQWPTLDMAKEAAKAAKKCDITHEPVQIVPVTADGTLGTPIPLEAL